MLFLALQLFFEKLSLGIGPTFPKEQVTFHNTGCRVILTIWLQIPTFTDKTQPISRQPPPYLIVLYAISFVLS